MNASSFPVFSFSFEGSQQLQGTRSTQSKDERDQTQNIEVSSVTSSVTGFDFDDEYRGRGLDLWSRIGFLPLYADVKVDSIPVFRKLTESSEDITMGDNDDDKDSDDSRFMMVAIGSDDSTGTQKDEPFSC